MTKNEMSQLLRSVGVNENTITAMENAYEIGVEFERDRIFAELHRMHENASGQHKYYLHAVIHIRAKGEEQEGLWLGKKAEAKAWQGGEA